MILTFFLFPTYILQVTVRLFKKLPKHIDILARCAILKRVPHRCSGKIIHTFNWESKILTVKDHKAGASPAQLPARSNTLKSAHLANSFTIWNPTG